ncbi:FlgB family protein [Pseudoponticoccus marisrubri]|uniref:Flagellar biosynthesis protein FlgB n=1 Tax=Pseudoponticoccus marisrubri TaxID=1685382 RepID=A0A0W7WGK3_9RHOB|nr:FlgB family protein [Pseudoponticoccus marisrubri]KUF09607.1 flagellar biosynthesis protein FlgB [Pseudoponticoccus marisrubri]
MFENLDVFRTAMTMARHAGLQQAYSAQNMANADTPGYRAREMPAFRLAGDTLDTAQKATRAGHLHGTTRTIFEARDRDTPADPNGNTVSLEQEMLAAVGAKRQHDRALAIYRSNLTILRTSLGRS